MPRPLFPAAVPVQLAMSVHVGTWREAMAAVVRLRKERGLTQTKFRTACIAIAPTADACLADACDRFERAKGALACSRSDESTCARSYDSIPAASESTAGPAKPGAESTGRVWRGQSRTSSSAS